MSQKIVGKPLTADLVFTKTKSNNLENIKNLNLWGNDLEDLSLIQKMPNLEVISLSVNRISSLKYFTNCQKLQELYLRKNNVQDIREIKYLINLPSLKVLWLHDNPCAQIQNYRSIVVKYLPNLMKLDNNPVTPQQRASGQNINFIIQMPKKDIKNQSNYRQQKQTGYKEQLKPKIQPNLPKQPEPGSQYISQKQEQNKYKQQLYKKAKVQRQKKIYETAKQQDITRNQNILMAVLSLMRELDSGSLEIVRRQAQKLLR